MFLGFRGNLRRADHRSVFFLFLKIERSEGEKEHRSENEKNDGFRKPSEEVENRREYEVYEEEQDVHPPRS